MSVNVHKALFIYIVWVASLSAGLSGLVYGHTSERKDVDESGWRAAYCPLWIPSPTSPPFLTVKAGDVHRLAWLLQHAQPGTVIGLEEGEYRLGADSSLVVTQPRLTLTGLSGSRESVQILGGTITLAVQADDFTVANITLRAPKFHGIQVYGEQGASRIHVYNVHILDAGQQLFKVSTGDGRKGKFSDDGVIACSRFEYTTYAVGTDRTPPSYTNGVDLLAGRGWIIRDNVFSRIRSQAGPAGPAILVWKNAQDTIVIRNMIIDSWRGIALGLAPPDRQSRGGASVLYDHQNGIVENNVILALHEPADAAIENNFAKDSRIFHNTIYYTEDLDHAVPWSIEYRYGPTTVIIKNNLTNRPIRKRFPWPTSRAEITGNITQAKREWFRDVFAADIHLRPGSPAIDYREATLVSYWDIDGTCRPVGVRPDSGADEFVLPGIPLPAEAPCARKKYGTLPSDRMFTR
ncbi:MAG: hypothetical protein D6704_02140 [Nitrospirae bacterium]|nr:MAG: hypothetical protein D6704_02140 [Nitrospirota bacterium]